MHTPNRRPFAAPIFAVIVLGAAALMLFLYGRIDFVRPNYAEWDLHQYLQMARAVPHLAQGIPRPFCYRLLGPWLAGLFHGHEILGFRCATAFFSVTLAIGFYGYLLRHGISPGIAAAAAWLLIANKWMFGFQAWDYFQIDDLLAQCLLLAAFHAMERRQWPLFAAALLLASMTRETAMLMIPVSGVYLAQTHRLRRDLPVWVAAIAPAVLCFAAIRLRIHPSGGPSLAEGLTNYWPKIASPNAWFHLLVSPFIPVALLPLIFLKTTLAFFRDRLDMLLFVTLVFFSTLFGYDSERLVCPAFLVYYLLIAVILERHFAILPGAIVLLMACALASSIDFRVGRWPVSIPVAHRLGYIALAAVTFAGVANRIRERTE